LIPAGRTHAKALARAGRLDEAMSLALRTAELVVRTDAIDDQGETAAATAEVRALAGDQVGAREAVVDAVASFEQKGNVVSATRVRQDEKNWGKPD
jgi:hypothetical protein